MRRLPRIVQPGPVIIQDGSIWAELVQGSVDQVDSALAVVNPQAKWVRKRHKLSKAVWDGKKHFYRPGHNQLPTGLAHKVIEKLGGTILPDTRLKRYLDAIPESDLAAIDPHVLDGIALREYQLELIRAMFTHGKGVIKAATNAGKTECHIAFVRILDAYFPDVIKVTYLVGRKDLLHQTYERFRLRWPGCSVGRLGDGYNEVGAKIIITTVQTLCPKVCVSKDSEREVDQQVLRHLRESQVLIVDEGHHAPAKTWARLCRECWAPFRFVSSGTPFTRDPIADWEVLGVGGPVIYEVSNQYLIKRGYSAVPTLNMIELDAYWHDLDALPYVPEENTPCLVKAAGSSAPREATFIRRETEPESAEEDAALIATGKSFVSFNDTAGTVLVPSSDLSTHCAYDRSITTFDPRNIEIVRWVHKFVKAKKPVLVIVTKTFHGYLLTSLLRARNMAACFIYGGTSTEDRKSAYTALSAGRMHVIVASIISQEGLDLPDVRAIVIAAGGKSFVATLQRAGRGLRRKKKDNTVDLVDFMDYQNDYMLKHSVARLKDYGYEQFPLKVWKPGDAL